MNPLVGFPIDMVTQAEVGGQDRVVVKAFASLGQERGFESCCYQKQKNAHWADPCTEGAQIVRQDLSGRPAM